MAISLPFIDSLRLCISEFKPLRSKFTLVLILRILLSYNLSISSLNAIEPKLFCDGRISNTL